MDAFICNKCFATLNRGKQPFHLTQCGHIYCQQCIHEAEKQCFQCKQTGVFSIMLQEPSLSRVANFFMPINESLISLQKVCAFQSSQMKIMVQRFQGVDKKYEMVKTQYHGATQHIKLMTDKYYKLKEICEKLQKRVQSLEVHNVSMSSSSNMSTPFNPAAQRKMRHFVHPSFSNNESYGTNTLTPAQSYTMTNGRLTSEGFRIPRSKAAKIPGSRTISDTSSTCTSFRR